MSSQDAPDSAGGEQFELNGSRCSLRGLGSMHGVMMSRKEDFKWFLWWYRLSYSLWDIKKVNKNVRDSFFTVESLRQDTPFRHFRRKLNLTLNNLYFNLKPKFSICCNLLFLINSHFMLNPAPQANSSLISSVNSLPDPKITPENVRELQDVLKTQSSPSLVRALSSKVWNYTYTLAYTNVHKYTHCLTL